MAPQCLRSHLKEPWRRPIGKLQIIGSTDELPPALDGVVELDAYRDMIGSVAEKAANYRGAFPIATFPMTSKRSILLVVLSPS